MKKRRASISLLRAMRCVACSGQGQLFKGEAGPTLLGGLNELQIVFSGYRTAALPSGNGLIWLAEVGG